MLKTGEGPQEGAFSGTGFTYHGENRSRFEYNFNFIQDFRTMPLYGYGAMLSPIIRRIQRRIGPGDRCGWRGPPISKEGSQSDEGQREQQQQDTQNGGFVEVPLGSFKDDTCRHDAGFPSDVSTNHDHGTDLSNGSAKRQNDGMVDATSRQTHLEKKPLTRADSHGFQYVTNVLFNLRKCTP